LACLRQLYDLAYERGIEINDYHFSDAKKAMCIHYDDYKSITLDKPLIEDSAEETILLAEELGHYETGSLYFLESTSNTENYKNNRIWCEGKAKRWKIKKLLPFNDLRDAIHSGIKNYYELAEYFNLPKDFIESAILYYTESLGMSIDESDNNFFDNHAP